jgi:crossover junction endodeoxyribonuclease RuvC
MTTRVRVLGIDPGYRLTGYGLIDTDGQQSRHVASGNIQTANADTATRLKSIYLEVRRVVDEFHPDEVAVEKVFMHRNADSALKLGQARAAAICATFGTELVVYEYAARLVKQSVVGRGNADKVQVQHMVKALLAIEAALGADESDALAVALCHAHTRPLARRLEQSRVALAGTRR